MKNTVSRPAKASMAVAAGILAFPPGEARAGGHHHMASGTQVSTVSVPVQAVQPQFVSTAPVVATPPLLGGIRYQPAVNFAPASTAAMPVAATPFVPTFFTFGAPGAAAQVPQGQPFNTASAAVALAQNPVVESVPPSEAPHLTTFVDASGNNIGGKIKGLLRKFLNSVGPDGKNQPLLKEIGTILLDIFVPANTLNFNRGSALNDIDSIINSLLNEKPPVNPGGLSAGTYQVSITTADGKVLTGTITIGGSGDDVKPAPPAPPQPPNPNASDADDRDSRGPSQSPF